MSKTNSLYGLHNVWLHPTFYFQTLEHQGNADDRVTVGEVQACMMDYVIAKIKELEFVYPINKASFETLPPINWVMPFKSEKASTGEGYDPWHLPVPAQEKVYTFTLRFVDKRLSRVNKSGNPKTMIYVDTLIRLSNIVKESCKLLYEFPGELKDKIEIDAFIEKVKKDALTLAQNVAAVEAIKYLTKYSGIRTRPHKEACKSEFVKDIVTTKFYFDALCNEKLRFVDLVYLLGDQGQNLTQSSVIELLKENIFDLTQAKSLTPNQRSIVGQRIYFNLLMKQEIVLQDLASISLERTQFLLLPAVLQLILAKRITFQQALILPIYLIPIFENPFYLLFLIKKGVPNEIYSFPESRVQLALKPVIACLIANETFTFSDIANLTTSQLMLIASHPRLVGYAENGILSRNRFIEISQWSLRILYSDVFAERLFAIIINQPYCLKNTDSVHMLLGELQEISDELAIPLLKLKERVVERLVIKIKSYIKKSSEFKDFETELHSEVTTYLQDCGNDVNWFIMLALFIKIAKSTLLKLQLNVQFSAESTFPLEHNALFSKCKISELDAMLEKFCENLVALFPLVELQSVNTLYPKAI